MSDSKPASPENENVDEPREPESIPEDKTRHIAHPDEDHHTPLSARVLKVLFLLSVGAGVGLWGAPKLAPVLPQGMAPVAQFLMPGQVEAKKDVADLKAELSDRLATLEARPVGSVTQEDIDRALAAYAETDLAALDALRDRLAAIEVQDIEARLAKSESRLQDVTAELKAMNERLALQITKNGAALSENAAAKLSGYQAVVDGLRAQIEDLASRNRSLSQRMDEVEKAALRQAQAVQQGVSAMVVNTASAKLLADIRSALDSGASFQVALEGLAHAADISPPPALATVAATGTPSLAILRAQFGDVAIEALRADTQARSGDGVVGKLGAFLRTQVGTRSLVRQEGDSTDAILSRVEDELAKGNLARALMETGSLSDEAKAAMQAWIADLERLNAAETAMADISRSLGLSN